MKITRKIYKKGEVSEVMRAISIPVMAVRDQMILRPHRKKHKRDGNNRIYYEVKNKKIF